MTYELCTIPRAVDAAIRAAVGIPAHIRIDLHITPEDIPVRGNASAWGEPEDSEHAAAIEHRLADGDWWAWCVVRVTCTDGTAEGMAYLGGCSYEDTDDFTKYSSGYLCDLAEEAYDYFQAKVAP
jgi:hypothetical protein